MNAENKKTRQLILDTLKEKGYLKQHIFEQTFEIFEELKSILAETNKYFTRKLNSEDKKLYFQYKDKGDFEAVVSFAGDTLIFTMHTNVFNFERSHSIWKQSYVKEDESRSYCCVINVYNFLTDSFRYDRENDLGYLIARIFVNKDKHYFVEGKRQLGFLYNDFATAVINREALINIVDSTILYTIDFDLLMPDYDSVKQVSVSDINLAYETLQPVTAKRLGFKFQADNLD